MGMEGVLKGYSCCNLQKHHQHSYHHPLKIAFVLLVGDDEAGQEWGVGLSIIENKR